jgi:hypothetical protein
MKSSKQFLSFVGEEWHIAGSIDRGQMPQDNLQEQAEGSDEWITSTRRAAQYRRRRTIDQLPEGNLSGGTMVAQSISDSVAARGVKTTTEHLTKELPLFAASPKPR